MCLLYLITDPRLVLFHYRKWSRRELTFSVLASCSDTFLQYVTTSLPVAFGLTVLISCPDIQQLSPLQHRLVPSNYTNRLRILKIFSCRPPELMVCQLKSTRLNTASLVESNNIHLVPVVQISNFPSEYFLL